VAGEWLKLADGGANLVAVSAARWEKIQLLRPWLQIAEDD
jgi:hypothetical protein